MNGPQHYREAEKLLRRAEGYDVEGANLAVAAAQAHATLALAAATALPTDALDTWETAAGTPKPEPAAPSYKTAQCERCGGAIDTQYGEWQHSDSGYAGCGPDGNGPGFAEPVDEQDGGRSDG